MKRSKLYIIPLAAIVLLCVVMRLAKFPGNNFIPLGALALVSGVYIRSRWGILVPLFIMVGTDLVIGLHSLILFTWGSYLLIGMIGWWVRQHKNAARIIGGTLAGSLLFYVITNFAVWAFTPLYAKTAAGLVQCFYMALPFFRNTVAGDLFFVGAFFGLYEASYYLMTSRRQKEIMVAPEI